MTRFAFCMTVLATTALAGAVWAEPDTKEEEPSLRMELDLVDGSHIIGTTSIESVPVETAYARIDIPLRHILTLTIGDDRETAAIELRNGDRLKGVVALGPVALDTVFGKVAIGIEHIRTLRVSLPGGAFDRKGLVLWNRLDSENDVTRSVFGPGGTFNAGRFVDGRFGKGIELNMQEQFGVTFPAEIVPAAAGCIEFWARLADIPQALPWGQKPGLIGLDEKDGGNWGSILNFNGNDGAGNAGLCAGLGGIGSAYGSWTYARALGEDTIGEWHHYALVWATAGIPGIADGTRGLAVFVDGRLNTGSWKGAVVPTGPLTLPDGGRLGLLCHRGTPGGRVVFDNLKIWNYAKTDFSDRTEE